ncbi:MAG TPA: GNAT family N-acetyltransferase [Blastocatellia bacterium]|nr:GNAT family N-acetyltransferase [Blastocatellia bacterium]
MRLSYSSDPELVDRVFDLLDVVFPGAREVADNARAIGASWESVSTPFVYSEDGSVLSHVGLIEIPLILLGQAVTVGSVHGVATHPRRRRRGYFRLLIEEVLEYSAGRYETLILTTEHPEYFEPFGFRVIQEHLYAVRGDWPGGSDGMRLIDVRDPGDIALLHRLLETREPVSQVVGVVNEKGVFCFNEGSRALRYSEDLDVVVCLELEGTRLRLYDIVGPKLPPLSALLDRIPQRIDQVDICFAADRFAREARITRYIFDHDGPSYLMARGPFAAEGRHFTLPRSART